MIAEFGIDSGWLDYPAVMERLWKLAERRWANRVKAIRAQEKVVEEDQREGMRAKLKAMVGG